LSSENIIKKYLLGELSADEKASVEERLMVDRDFFEQMGIVEDELIDDYLEGNLANKNEFERYILSNPKQYRRLKIVMALRKTASEWNGSRSEPLNKKGSRSWLRALWAPLKVNPDIAKAS